VFGEALEKAHQNVAALPASRDLQQVAESVRRGWTGPAIFGCRQHVNVNNRIDFISVERNDGDQVITVVGDRLGGAASEQQKHGLIGHLSIHKGASATIGRPKQWSGL